MAIQTRHEDILNLLRMNGAVEVEDLAARFGLTTQTIRQDLRELGDRGLLKRTHGGAHKLASVTARDYSERRLDKAAAKRAIGAAAAALIPNNASVTLNIGTTTEQVAQALSDHSGLTVLSNNINIINQLSGTRVAELIQVGGRVRQSDGAVVGDDAVEFLSRYKTDIAVIGTSSLDDDGAVLDFDLQEVAVARAILKNARTRVLVADGSKFGVNAPVRICDLADLDYIVTDTPPPRAFQDAAKAGGTEILVAETRV